MNNSDYKYLSKNVFIDKINYSYSKFEGNDFIFTWRNTRLNCISFISKKCINNYNNGFHFDLNKFDNNTEFILNQWIKSILETSNIDNRVDLLLKRFEVTKRIYSSYDSNFRPINKNDYSIVELYCKFGVLLSLLYDNTKKFQYLNSLLKLNDILCSIYQIMIEDELLTFNYILKKEIEFIDNILKNNNL